MNFKYSFFVFTDTDNNNYVYCVINNTHILLDINISKSDEKSDEILKTVITSIDTG